MKVKVSDATGPVLDWMVATANLNGKDWVKFHFGNFAVRGKYLYLNSEVSHPYSPSTDWAQGGPIIEREKIAVQFGPQWTAVHHKHLGKFHYGSTPLVAAMRCYVASKLGNEVEVPDALLDSQ